MQTGCAEIPPLERSSESGGSLKLIFVHGAQSTEVTVNEKHSLCNVLAALFRENTGVLFADGECKPTCKAPNCGSWHLEAVLLESGAEHCAACNRTLEASDECLRCDSRHFMCVLCALGTCLCLWTAFESVVDNYYGLWLRRKQMLEETATVVTVTVQSAAKGKQPYYCFRDEETGVLRETHRTSALRLDEFKAEHSASANDGKDVIVPYDWWELPIWQLLASHSSVWRIEVEAMCVLADTRQRLWRKIAQVQNRVYDAWQKKRKLAAADLDVGDLVVARDGEGHWFPVVVIGSHTGGGKAHVFVHFMGWGAQFDECKHYVRDNVVPLDTADTWQLHVDPVYERRRCRHRGPVLLQPLREQSPLREQPLADASKDKEPKTQPKTQSKTQPMAALSTAVATRSRSMPTTLTTTTPMQVVNESSTALVGRKLTKTMRSGANDGAMSTEQKEKTSGKRNVTDARATDVLHLSKTQEVHSADTAKAAELSAESTATHSAAAATELKPLKLSFDFAKEPAKKKRKTEQMAEESAETGALDSKSSMSAPLDTASAVGGAIGSEAETVAMEKTVSASQSATECVATAQQSSGSLVASDSANDSLGAEVPAVAEHCAQQSADEGSDVFQDWDKAVSSFKVARRSQMNAKKAVDVLESQKSVLETRLQRINDELSQKNAMLVTVEISLKGKKDKLRALTEKL